jgi:hypothetical protein
MKFSQGIAILSADAQRVGDRMSFTKSVFPTLLFVGTAAGVTDHVWSVADIVTIIEAAEPAPAKRGPYKKQATA